MRRCLLLLACAFAGLPAPAQLPDPGVLAQQFADNTPAPDHSPSIASQTSIQLTQLSPTELASSTLPSLSSPPSASSTEPPILKAPTTPASAPSPKSVVTPAPAPVPLPSAPKEESQSLAPPSEPLAPPLPKPATSPMVLRHDGDGVNPTSVPKPAAKTDPADDARTSVNVNRYDGTIRDSFGLVSVPVQPDATGELPFCFQRVEFLRKHHDPILATAYLRQIIDNGELVPQYKARAILELADGLSSLHQDAEALCWLRIWAELYPTRPEFGAVAYRIGTLYREMGLPSLARDAYYLALAHTVNQGQVQNPDDLKQYTRLTESTLWELAANEYQSGQWARAAELFTRYRQEATSASPVSLEKAAYLQADCSYQLKQTDKAVSLYEAVLKDHPFNPLAPQARLRLYHLYVMKNDYQNAKEDLQALAWSVRTVWPKEETYWQKQTAELLLALNQKNADVLPPLFQQSSQLPPEGKTWQEALDHYDALVSYQAAATQGAMDTPAKLAKGTGTRHKIAEETDLMAMNNDINQLLPPQSPRTASSP